MNIESDQIVSIPLANITPNPHQPRRDFDPVELERLAESLKTSELMQPIGVRPLAGSNFQLIWGERRLRAAMLAGWGSINARIIRASDKQTLTMLARENLHRVDWNAIEKAVYIESLATPVEVGGAGLKTSQEIADMLGFDVSWVCRLRRLLSLPEKFQEWVKTGEWSVTAALVVYQPFKDKPHVLKAISEDYESNRAAWGSREVSIRRARTIASRFASVDELDNKPNQPAIRDADGELLATVGRTSQDLPSRVAAAPVAQSPPPATPPIPAALDRFKEYRPLVAQFSGDLTALRRLRDMVNDMIDALLANANK